MITVTEAKDLVQKHCTAFNIVEVSLPDSRGQILATEIYAAIDTPPFNQSAMDGYAFSFAAWDKKSALTLTGEIQAGNFPSTPLQPNEAIRIYTGAPLPIGADTVVMQEKISKSAHAILILDEQLVQGTNVRLMGSQTRKGALALGAGVLLTPGAISFLAGIGVSKVKIYANPKVSIIVTGKELTAPNEEINAGKIYESNSYGLIAALQQLGISSLTAETVDDEIDQITQAITNSLTSDFIILTGGVSVGDYDLVPAALQQCGVEKIFHKVKQKPGKPLFFGKNKQTLVFGLPGNPAAALTCFYEYIAPAIYTFTKKESLKKLALPLSKNYFKKPGLTHFLKGLAAEDSVTLLEGQESYLMNSFALANCIVELKETQDDFVAGELVNVRMII